MERTNPFLFQSAVRELSDITNFHPNPTNPDAFRQALKSSYVDENSYDQKSARSTSSRDQNCVKGLNRYDKSAKTTTFKLPLETLPSTDKSAKKYGTATTPRNFLSYSDQMYSTYTESYSFKNKKPS